MSAPGQTRKSSLRAHIVRFALGSGPKSDIAGGPFGADIVAKVENRVKIARKWIFRHLYRLIPRGADAKVRGHFPHIAPNETHQRS